MEIGALPVLDDLVEKDILFAGRLHPTGNLGKARGDCCMEATFAADDLIGVLAIEEANADRLKDAELPDRFRQLLLGLSREVFSRLGWVGPDAGKLDEKCACQPATAFAVR